MSKQTTMTVRMSGVLSDFVASNVGEHGSFENVSEYLRDLVRKDKERKEQLDFERLKNELQLAFSASDSTCSLLTADDIIARNRR